MKPRCTTPTSTTPTMAAGTATKAPMKRSLSRPASSGELTHTFDDAGTIEIGCHQPGHYDAGMTITVEVT